MQKERKEKLDNIWEQLLKNYSRDFDVAAPVDFIKPILEEHLTLLSRKFILGRIEGGDPADLRYLISLANNPVLEPVPDPVPVKKEIPVVHQVPKRKGNKRS